MSRATKRWEPVDDMMAIERLMVELQEEIALHEGG